jgi:hypothetical protein
MAYHPRCDYRHCELIIDNRKRSFTTETKEYNEAKKKRARFTGAQSNDDRRTSDKRIIYRCRPKEI